MKRIEPLLTRKPKEVSYRRWFLLDCLLALGNIFLVTAIITGQFAATLRQRAEDANRRERETHILYDLVRATNREEDLELQLSIFAHAVVEVFFPWGIQDCRLLLPDEQGTLQPSDHKELSSEERTTAERIIKQPEIVDLPLDMDIHVSNAITQKTVYRQPISRYMRLVPLKTELQVFGVLCLFIEHNRYKHTIDNILTLEHNHPTPDELFFSTFFLEQAVVVIERGHLRQESFRVNMLKQTDTLRSALLSSVSHDLRTPLSTIKTAATSLLEQWSHMDRTTDRRRRHA